MTGSELISAATAWARGRSDVRGLALVGSHARGEPTPKSDVDLVVVVDDPSVYISGHDWAAAFGSVARTTIEPYGIVTSVRVEYRDGPEVEFGFTTPKWCETPVHPTTRHVVSHACRVLHDPAGLVAGLCNVCAAS
jgi:hypothetical protein